jgi:hypothetical protein
VKPGAGHPFLSKIASFFRLENPASDELRLKRDNALGRCLGAPVSCAQPSGREWNFINPIELIVAQHVVL